MCETHKEMHLHDMPEIDIRVFQIVVGGGDLIVPPGHQCSEISRIGYD